MSMFDSIIENSDIIVEGLVYSDDNYMIAVDNTQGHKGQGVSYFKFYDKKKNEIARILITEPKYIEHKNSSKTNRGGNPVKSTTNLNSTQKKALMKILNKESNTGNYKNMDISTYKAAILTANEYSGVSKKDIEKYKDSTLDDTPRNIIPYNMKMPDYMDL